MARLGHHFGILVVPGAPKGSPDASETFTEWPADLRMLPFRVPRGGSVLETFAVMLHAVFLTRILVCFGVAFGRALNAEIVDSVRDVS